MGFHCTGKLADFGRPELARDCQRRIVDRVGKELLHRTVDHTPVAKPPPGHASEWLAARKRAPGTLKASWKCGEVTIELGGETMSIDVYTHDQIAPYVEYPTQAHVIWSRPGHVLRFWTKLGNTVYAALVHHPGTGGAYMLTTAIAEVGAMWREIGAEELERWAREAMAAV